jgi:spore germination cell wall hydrolase CwlJ-like protein
METVKNILLGFVFAATCYFIYYLIIMAHQIDNPYDSHTVTEAVSDNQLSLIDDNYERSKPKNLTAEVPRRVRPDNDEEVYCLALNIYHEARGSSFADQVGVTDVVLNRMYDRRYPDTVCGVVYQARISQWHLENTGRRVPVRNQCQFSWHCNGRPDEPRDQESWKHSQYLAYKMYYYDNFRGITEGATHYHATYVSPFWASELQLVGQIGSHIYYRWQ